jgi:hypothetical protein
LIGYWTEHSERRFLNSKAAEMGISEATRNFLGRWLPKESDNYLVTARATVYNVQDQVARQFLQAPKSFDESEIFGQVTTRMKLAGLGDDRVSVQLDSFQKPLLAFQAFVASSTASASSGDESSCEPQPSCEPVVEEVQPGGSPVFMISRTKKRGILTVHLCQGGCYRRAGIELSSVTYASELEDSDLSLRCKDCFRETRKTIDDTGNESSSTGDESSSTDPELNS